MSDKRKIVVIGGVAGGATAAGRARRMNESAEITVLERGGEISFANCGLPYHISGDIPERKSLILRSAKAFWDRYRILAKTNVEVTRIDRSAKVVFFKEGGKEDKISYDKLILSQGAAPMLPPVAGLENIPAFSLRTLEDMDSINLQTSKASSKNVIVVGGGFIGVEMAEAFVKRGFTVDLVEFAPQIMISVDSEFAQMAEEEMIKHGVRVHKGTKIESVSKEKEALLANGIKIHADFILFAAGVRPELELAKNAGLKIGEFGGLSVNEYLQTSDPDIYAAGDMIEVLHRISGKTVRIPLAGPANRQGRIAADNASADAKKKYNGAVGTAVVKVFDKTLGATGLTEKFLRQSGSDVGVSFVHSNNHAGYFPGAERLALKLVYDRKTGKLLGAQCFGGDGADKRIDTAATALASGMTVEAMAELDLAYAPPFSSANDPINFAAFQAVNQMEGSVNIISASELDSLKDYFFLDVRNPDEISRYKVNTSLQVKVDSLRDHISEIPKDRKIVCLCQSGQRSYIASRILVQSGFKDVVNLAGGYWTLSAYRKSVNKEI